MKYHNYQLERFTDFFYRLTKIVSLYALFSTTFLFGSTLVVKGFFSIHNFEHLYRLQTACFLPFLMIINIELYRHFKRVDAKAPKNPRSTDTATFAFMNLFKLVAAFAALLIGWKTATMLFFGIDFWSFAPEYSFFVEGRYTHAALYEAQHAFLWTDFDAMFIKLYASMTAFFVVVAGGYSLMMRSVVVSNRNAYYMSLRRT
ncbi:hypothetical protein AO073_01390 [Pseudomonas syringae ICMP 11293]|uniref:hypothetical protein n=1 Tax=Pseudomonas syringae TaxID=317 RepID=UPI000731261D|nr:hypothetical protein [Pseudomonas syringae]KTB91554.1 hypothetical protein AO073_01390 [Pseudomonas syringae ICMP 11293]